MLGRGIGYGWNDVPRGSGKIVAYAPLNLANLHWTIAVSEDMRITIALLQQNTRAYTLIAILLSLVILGVSVHLSRKNYLRHLAAQEALHVHEERHLKQQLDREHEQLLEAERFATVGRMAAQVAHEIKNPLSSISLNVELLGDELQADGRHSSPEARNLIQSILSEIDLLTITIDEYLQFARFPKLQKQETSLAQTFAGLQQLLQEESTSRAIALQSSVHPSLTRISADPRLLRQALLNLVRNAFEAIGREGWVRVEAMHENGDVRLEVTDSGPGIASEHLPMLFEPFFTTKPKGTGLGLPLTRHIIFEHGGSINYEPAGDGHASRFVITLPLDNPGPPKGEA